MQTAPVRQARRPSVVVVAGVAVLANFLGWFFLARQFSGDLLIYAVPASSLVVGVLSTLWGSSRRYGIAIIVGTAAAVGLARLGLVLAFMSGQLGE